MWLPGQPQTEPPILRQSIDPTDGKQFESREEAENWIVNYIADITKPQEPVEPVEPVVE